MTATRTNPDPLADLLGPTGDIASRKAGSPNQSAPVVIDSPFPAPSAPENPDPLPGAALSLSAIVTTKELAAFLDVSRVTIGNLADDGVLTRAGRGRWNLAESVQAYIGHLRKVAAGRTARAVDEETKAEKLRLTAAQADERELKLAAARRELLPAAEVRTEWAGILRNVRAGMLSVPGRAASRLGHLSAHDLSELDLEIRDVLAALKPPSRLPLSEWMESEMKLPEGVSATPGAVRLWPYQRGIADAISDPTIERVTLVKPVRVGFTTLLSGAVASFVANEPSPILCLLPTESDCRDYNWINRSAAVEQDQLATARQRGDGTQSIIYPAASRKGTPAPYLHGGSRNRKRTRFAKFLRMEFTI